MTDMEKDIVYMAKLAEEAERYDEMVEFMDKVSAAAAAKKEDLSIEKRNLLSFAYKNVIAPRRSSWKILSSIEQEEESSGNEDHVALIKEFKAKIESELTSTCCKILKLLESSLISSASSNFSLIFYLEMKGNYNRYLAEFKIGSDRTDAVVNALSAYTSAQKIAREELTPSNPIRLGLALNFSVFYNDIMNNPDRAYDLAKQAFDEAIVELYTLDEESFQESTIIMQVLRNNLAIWTSNVQEDDDDDDVEIEEDG